MVNLGISGVSCAQVFQNPNMWASNKIQNMSRNFNKAEKMNFRGFLLSNAGSTFSRLA